MSYSRRSRYSRSPSHDPYSRSISRSKYLSRGQSSSPDSSDAENPGNNLYVTGLSTRVKERDIEKHFSTEGTVEDVHLVVDPWTRESRGFGFVTMSSVKEADCCIKYLNRSILEGRVITVEKARRRRGRTPTPGRYLGLRTVCGRHESRSYSPHSRSRSPHYSLERDSSRSRDRSRSYSPYYRQRRRSYSHYYNRGSRRSYSPYYSRGSYLRYSRRRSYSRSSSPYSRSPVSQRDRSYSPDGCYYYRRRRHRDYSPGRPRHDGSDSPDDRYYYRRRHHRDYSPYSRRDCSYSPDDRYYKRSRYDDYSPDDRWRARSYSPDNRYYRRSHYRDYSPDGSYSHRKSRYRSISQSVSPRYRRSRRSYSHIASPSLSRRSYSRSVSSSSRSRSLSSPLKKSTRSVSCSSSPRPRRSSKKRSAYSGESSACRSSRSHSVSASSRFHSRSVTSRSSSTSS